jgi:hypothetical protein
MVVVGVRKSVLFFFKVFRNLFPNLTWTCYLKYITFKGWISNKFTKEYIVITIIGDLTSCTGTV